MNDTCQIQTCGDVQKNKELYLLYSTGEEMSSLTDKTLK